MLLGFIQFSVLVSHSMQLAAVAWSMKGDSTIFKLLSDSTCVVTCSHLHIHQRRDHSSRCFIAGNHQKQHVCCCDFCHCKCLFPLSSCLQPSTPQASLSRLANGIVFLVLFPLQPSTACDHTCCTCILTSAWLGLACPWISMNSCWHVLALLCHSTSTKELLIKSNLSNLLQAVVNDTGQQHLPMWGQYSPHQLK